MAEVAVLGTGRMGSAMARRLVAADHRVHLWNRTQDTARTLADDLGPGAVVHAAPDQAVGSCDAVLSVLADGDITRSVLLDPAVLQALQRRCVVVDLATSGIDAARAVGEGLAAVGIPFVDAPVSGSVPAVLGGTLLVMASGPEGAVSQAEPILNAFARLVLRVGEVGAGQAMKLAVNLVVHDLNAAVAESLRLAESASIDREDAYRVLQESVVGAPFVQYKRAAFLDPATPVAMSLSLVEKDLRLITELADRTGEPVPVTRSALAEVRSAVAAGLGDRDMADLSRVPREGISDAPA